MKFRHELVYDAPPDEVLAMLADPTFRAKVCDAQGVVSHDIDLTPTDTGFTLVNDQVQNTAGLPSIAKKIVGDTTRAVVEETWTGHSATVVFTAPGKPTTASGTVRLEARGAGTAEVVELEVKVKVPVIGGKLESLMADTIKQGLEVENGVGTDWLEGRR